MGRLSVSPESTAPIKEEDHGDKVQQGETKEKGNILYQRVIC